MILMNTPRGYHLEITNHCNLRCKYCSHFTSPGDVGKDLPGEEWLRFFEELKECATMNVTLSGGDPFCRKDIMELIEGIVKNKMRFLILSNGGLITDEIAAAIKATNRCSGIQTSLDGASPETHDYCRGEGSFQKAVRGIQLLQKHKVPVTVRVTIHQKNVHQLEAVSRLLLEELKISTFSTNSVFNLGLCTTSSEDLQLTIQQRTEAMAKLVELSKKYAGRIQANAGPLSDAVLWGKMEKAFQQKSPPFQRGGHLMACGCVNAEMSVRADGVIVPCNLLGHIELGRINKDSIKDIWLNHPQMIRLRNRVKIPLKNFDLCKDCHYSDYCPGNCPVSAHSVTGKDEYPSTDYCYRLFLKKGGQLPESLRHPTDEEAGKHQAGSQ